MEEPTSIEDYWLENLSEEEFQTTFRLSRKTFVSLQAELDSQDNKDNEETDVSLLLSLWILGNNQPFDDALPLFSLEENTTIEEVMMTYFEKIMRLGSLYLSWPDINEADLIENGFAVDYGFPGVTGVIGSLHIEVAANGRRSPYYNSETKTHTFVLQVVCDDKLLLRDVCVGCPGSNSIEGILRSSPLYEKLTDENDYLVKKGKHLLGGTQHPQLRTLLTPYKGVDLSDRQAKFNELHAAVMYTVERTFECLKNRFPRLTSVGSLSPKVATLLVSAICVLHNFTRVRNDCCELYL